MPRRRVTSFEWTEYATNAAADDGLSQRRVESALDDPNMKIFGDPRGDGRRRLLIGKVHDGPIVTVVIEPPDERGESRIVTVWLANSGQVSLYQKSGGTQHVEID